MSWQKPPREASQPVVVAVALHHKVSTGAMVRFKC